MAPRRPPILEHPGRGPALIEPGRLADGRPGVAERVVLTFFTDLLNRYSQEGRLRPLFRIGGEGPPIPVYETSVNGSPVGVAWPGTGAPLAGAVLEQLIARGARKIICCGGAGALAPDCRPARQSCPWPRCATRGPPTTTRTAVGSVGPIAGRWRPSGPPAGPGSCP